ncbi:MAG: hypothetical protein NC827_05915 [Candidatus Omnitrophica bacterium]|nr:hypothetical protein [Candidatus Omnitrophota bacterium]
MKTMYIRNINDETYSNLLILRKRYKAKSWSELLDKIVEKLIKEVEKEWYI